MAQRIPEGLGRLPGQGAAGSVGNGAGNHHRPAPAAVLEELFDGEQRGLGVQRVEHRFNQQNVSAAIGQAANGFEIIGDQRIKSDVAVAGVIHVGRNRGGAAGRTEDAGDRPGPDHVPALRVGCGVDGHALPGVGGEPQQLGVAVLAHAGDAGVGREQLLDKLNRLSLQIANNLRSFRRVRLQVPW